MKKKISVIKWWEEKLIWALVTSGKNTKLQRVWQGFTAEAYKMGRLVETNQMISPLLTELPWRKGSVFGTTPVALTTKSQPKVFPLVSWTCSGHESPVGGQKRPSITQITNTVYTRCKPAFLPLSGWTGSSRVMIFSTSHSYSSKTLQGTWSHASREIGPDHFQTWTNSAIFLSKKETKRLRSLN